MKILSGLFILLALQGTALAQDISKFPYVQDSKLTPGLLDPTATKDIVCNRSTSTVRNVTAKMKADVYKAYGFQGKDCKDIYPDGCEVDHLVSLELGGTNSDSGQSVTANLWPQPYEIYGIVDGKKIRLGAHEKDLVENDLHRRVCKTGDMTLEQAQTAITTNWINYYLEMRKLGTHKQAATLPRR